MKIKDSFCYIDIFDIDSLLFKKADINIYPSEELSENLQIMYEWEYKRSVVEQDRNMLPQRKENMLNMIDKQIIPVLNKIIDSLLYVFRDWLDKHAILNPMLWAEKRFDGDMLEVEDPKTILENIKYQYKEYSSDKGRDFENQFFKSNLEYLQSDLKLILDDIINNNIEDLEYYKEREDEESIQKQEETINYLQNIDLSNEEDRLRFYQEYLDESMEFNISNNSNFKNMCINFMAKVLFPLWFNKWKEEGIVETRRNIEDLYKNLKKSKRFPFKEKITAIHLALNSTHQTGDMMDYINEMYHDVDNNLLDELSNTDQDTLNKWKQEILVG
jgi:hypothetical protein